MSQKLRRFITIYGNTNTNTNIINITYNNKNMTILP